MKRPAGLTIIAAFVFLMGMQMIARAKPDPAWLGGLQVTAGLLALLAALRLWYERADAIKAYWVWVLSILGLAAITQLVSETPLPEVVISLTFVAMFWAAVGAYLTGTLRRTL